MSFIRYIVFVCSIFNIIDQIDGLNALPKVEDNNLKQTSEIIRSATNGIFSAFKLKGKKDNVRLKFFSAVHNYLTSEALLDYTALKEIAKLTRVDKTGSNNQTAHFIDYLNEITAEFDENKNKSTEVTINEYFQNVFHKKVKEYREGRFNENNTSAVNAKLEESHEVNDSTTTVNPEFESNVTTDLEIWSPNPLLGGSRRIFKGKFDRIHFYPFIVSIHVMGKFMCAGSIIKSDLVITSASCLQLAYNNKFFRENPNYLYVRAGSTFYDFGGEMIHAMEVYFHPSYVPKTLANNLAIMRLVRHMRFDKHRSVKKIRIDALAHSMPADVSGITIVGWGAQGPSDIVKGPWVNRLSSVKLEYYPFLDCEAHYGKDFVRQENFCLGYVTTGEGACNKDAGGPAIFNGVLMGVISFGAKKCGTPDSPTVVTKLGYYTKWIKSIVALGNYVPETMARTTPIPPWSTRGFPPTQYSYRLGVYTFAMPKLHFREEQDDQEQGREQQEQGREEQKQEREQQGPDVLQDNVNEDNPEIFGKMVNKVFSRNDVNKALMDTNQIISSINENEAKLRADDQLMSHVTFLNNPYQFSTHSLPESLTNSYALSISRNPGANIIRMNTYQRSSEQPFGAAQFKFSFPVKIVPRTVPTPLTNPPNLTPEISYNKHKFENDVKVTLLDFMEHTVKDIHHDEDTQVLEGLHRIEEKLASADLPPVPRLMHLRYNSVPELPEMTSTTTKQFVERVQLQREGPLSMLKFEDARQFEMTSTTTTTTPLVSLSMQEFDDAQQFLMNFGTTEAEPRVTRLDSLVEEGDMMFRNQKLHFGLLGLNNQIQTEATTLANLQSFGQTAEPPLYGALFGNALAKLQGVSEVIITDPPVSLPEEFEMITVQPPTLSNTESVLEAFKLPSDLPNINQMPEFDQRPINVVTYGPLLDEKYENIQEVVITDAPKLNLEMNNFNFDWTTTPAIRIFSIPTETLKPFEFPVAPQINVDALKMAQKNELDFQKLFETPDKPFMNFEMPEIPSFNFGVPEALAPETVAPVTMAPETVASVTMAPETVASVTMAPVSVAPLNFLMPEMNLNPNPLSAVGPQKLDAAILEDLYKYGNPLMEMKKIVIEPETTPPTTTLTTTPPTTTTLDMQMFMLPDMKRRQSARKARKGVKKPLARRQNVARHVPKVSRKQKVQKTTKPYVYKNRNRVSGKGNVRRVAGRDQKRKEKRVSIRDQRRRGNYRRS